VIIKVSTRGVTHKKYCGNQSMKKSAARNLSANALQLVINQVFGFGIFYLLSTGLSKTNFGQINLVLAILLAVFNMLSLGIDQLIIKKIASGNDVQKTLSLYIFHVLFAGLVFYGILLSGKIFFTQQVDIYNLLLLVGIGKLMIFFSTPFKQVVSGLERFKLLTYMSIVSNIVRCLGLLAFALFHIMGMQTIVIIFITGDALELLVCIFLFKYSTQTSLSTKWDKASYLTLVCESLPQSGVVVITSALARFDWIFIGFTLSAIKLAEYSFAYKIFEISTLPLLAIAPLLIPHFTKLFKQESAENNNLGLLIRMEIIIAVLVGLLLNTCWSLIIDALTAGKYGAVNVKTIFLLSLCMPLLYVNNFLWTIYFAQGQLKMILRSFIITLCVNVAGDIILIPLYKNEGAAFAFLLSCAAQTIFYLKKNKIAQLNSIWRSLLICTGCALCSSFAVKFLLPNSFIALPSAVMIYFALLIVTNQLKLNDRKQLQVLFKW
jgi:O-antigen/teichoic acid export membrane protein